MRAQLLVPWLVGCGWGAVGEGDGVVDPDEVPGPGWTAELVGTAHDVSGTAVIVDETTLEILDFTYDGGGVDARFYLLADGEAFHRRFELSGNLVGAPSDGETLVLDLPEGGAFEDWNLLTLWCVDFRVSFANGVFEPPAD